MAICHDDGLQLNLLVGYMPLFFQHFLSILHKVFFNINEYANKVTDERYHWLNGSTLYIETKFGIKVI